MHVAVAGDSLVVTADKRWRGQSMYTFLRDGLLLPDGFIRKQCTTDRVRFGTLPATLDLPVDERHKIRLLGEVEEPYGVALSEGVGMEPLQVLYEDPHVLVVDKPTGLIIYPGEDSDTDTLAHRVALHYLETGQLHRVRHVHRLDKDTTGTILYAKHGYIARALDALLAERRIHRVYTALVQGVPPQTAGEIDLPIGRDRHVAGKYRVSKTGKEARTRYRVLGQTNVANGRVSLVECQLDTGRTHQIRVHLSALGCPIVGDVLYGGGAGVGPARLPGQALHAARLSFYHPYDEREVTVTAPLPPAFHQLLADLQLPEVDMSE